MEEYAPIDVSKVKPSKLRTEKDLEKEILEIWRILKDTTTADWKDRVKALETIQSIVITDRLTELPNFLKLIEKLVRPLITQLMDLRSAVTKEASNSVRMMAQILENDFRPLAAKFMHTSALFKLVSSATKIISEHGHLWWLAIVNYWQEPKIIENIFENMNSKNSNLRAKWSLYISIILSSWPEYILESVNGKTDYNRSLRGMQIKNHFTWQKFKHCQESIFVKAAGL